MKIKIKIAKLQNLAIIFFKKNTSVVGTSQKNLGGREGKINK
jgi:hypothetical protein